MFQQNSPQEVNNLQPDSKGDIIFIITIVITILVFILGTTGAIILTKKDNKPTPVDPENPHYEMPNLSLKFDPVENTNTIDIYKDYYRNPITINLEKEVSISGLKNKEIEQKINDSLSELTSSEKNRCTVNFNMSNVFSIMCIDDEDNQKIKTFDLTTGNPIKLEEIFNKDSDLQTMIIGAIYNNVCDYTSVCEPNSKVNPEDYDIEIDTEANILKILNRIKRGEYQISLHPSGVSLELDKREDQEYIVLNENSVEIQFKDYPKEITIYDRFLTEENIYIEEPTKEVLSSIIKNFYNFGNSIEIPYYGKSELLDKKTFIDSTINNYTGVLFHKTRSTSTVEKLDLEKIYENLSKALITKLNITGSKDYRYATMNSYIYNYDDNTYHVVVDYKTIDGTKDEFESLILNNYTTSLRETDNKKLITLIIDKDGNVVKTLDDNPEKRFNDFNTKLLKYIENNMNDDQDFADLKECINSENSNIEICGGSIEDLIKNDTVFAVDEDKKLVYLFMSKIGTAFYFVYIKTAIPFEIFE